MKDKWWRWQRNRAEKAGLSYAQAEVPYTPLLLQELRRVSDAWLQRAGHSEQGFALGYFDATYLQRCRLHLLRDASGQLVAFANEIPVYHASQQRSVDLIRFLPDQDGTMPYLLLKLLQDLHETGQGNRFDLGFVPLAKIDSSLADVARWLARGRFSAAGLEQFKGKFRPDWQPNFIAYDGDVLDLARIAASLESALKKESS